MGTIHSFRRRIADQLVNFVTGLGTWKDATSASFHNLTLLNRNEVENAYRSDWISRKIVDAPAEDATREWRQWQANNRQIELIEAEEKRLELQKKLRMAIIRARLYGGAALVLGVDQGETHEELVLDDVGKGALKYVVVLNRYELMAGPRIYNVDSPWYTRPEYYTVSTPIFGFSGESGTAYPGQTYGALVTEPRKQGQATSQQEEGDRARQMVPQVSGMVQVHPSRIIELSGNELPDWRLAPMGGGWGDSVLQTVDEAIKDWGLVMGGMASMVNDAKMDVIKIADFSKNIATAEYAQRLLTRFQMANSSKSTINSILLDKEEEWERIQTSFGGLPQLLREFMMVVAAAGGMPPSRIFGQSISKGLGGGSGGEDDLRNYYDDQASKQKTVYGPALTPLDQCLVRSALGRYDPSIYYTWNPLWQQDPKDVAAIALQKAQATKVYIDTALLNEDMMRKIVLNQLVEDGTYPGIEDAVDEFNEGEPDVPMSRVWSPGIDPHTGESVGPPKPPPFGGGGGPPGGPPLPGGAPPPPLPGMKDAGSDDEPRDEHGRWTSGGGGAAEEKTPQEKMKETLQKSGIPYHEVRVYGSQIMITTGSHEAAEKWSSLLSKFGRVRKAWKSVDENKGQDPGASIKKFHEVWRVAATMAHGSAFQKTSDAMSKSNKAEADYTPGPVDEEPCRACSMFVRPKACTKVAGVISPRGHCRYWEARAGDGVQMSLGGLWSAQNTSGKASGGDVYAKDPDALERNDEGSPAAIKGQRRRIKRSDPK